MKALSLREPWAAFMIRGIKRIENRSWRTSYRGTILVHASSWWRRNEVADDYDTASHIAVSSGKGRPDFEPADLKPHIGGIVGAFDIVDCVSESDDPFFFGPYGFVVENARRFPATIPCRGALGIFEVPADVAEACRAFLANAN